MPPAPKIATISKKTAIATLTVMVRMNPTKPIMKAAAPTEGMRTLKILFSFSISIFSCCSGVKFEFFFFSTIVY